jgi:two-component system sensor histidine kinase RegB
VARLRRAEQLMKPGVEVEAPVPKAAFLSTPAITLRWLVRLRWGAFAGQTATIAGSALLFRLALPLVPLGLVIGATAVSNVALARWMRRAPHVTPRAVAAVLVGDTLALGALLFFSGGPSNPFSVLFLVQITIAALVLGSGYTALVVALSVLVYALLFFDNVPLAGMEHMHHAGTSAFSLHLQGMFVAFALAAALIAYFVTRVSTALRERDLQLANAQRLAASNERLASLSTLAAGAAHELGTPLATIAIASKELDRAAQELSGAADLRDDARLIRQEVDRCRDIVQRMSAGAGGALGEAPEGVDPARIATELKARLDLPLATRLDVDATAAPVELTVPWRGLVQTLVTLVKNAFEASSADARVALTIEASGERARFIVKVAGQGMTPEELSHVGEPFFTTKAPGAGMGLGVFLARAFADRLGGSLAYDSARSRGTTAILEVPLRVGMMG